MPMSFHRILGLLAVLLLATLPLLASPPSDLPWSSCYASDTVNEVYIPAPKPTAAGTRDMGTTRALSHIYVKYNGFPAEYIPAIERAARIWETLIASPIPIHVDAYWEQREANVLASCRPGELVASIYQGAHVGVPLALMDKIQGRDLDPDVADMVMSVNSNYAAQWWTRTDGTPADLTHYDLTTVIMHEFAHGFGISGSFRTDTSSDDFMDWTGSYEVGAYYRTVDSSNPYVIIRTQFPTNVPTIYDYFVIDGYGNQLINSGVFDNDSYGLYCALTSNGLWWGGQTGTWANAGAWPKLYAPYEWNGGSSIAHLDGTTYAAKSINSMMTPSVGLGETVHNPGPVLLGMLADLGWGYTQQTYNFDLGIRASGDTAWVGVGDNPLRPPSRRSARRSPGCTTMCR